PRAYSPCVPLRRTPTPHANTRAALRHRTRTRAPYSDTEREHVRRTPTPHANTRAALRRRTRTRAPHSDAAREHARRTPTPNANTRAARDNAPTSSVLARGGCLWRLSSTGTRPFPCRIRQPCILAAAEFDRTARPAG